MKLLFDQNISFRIIKQISDTFPVAKQVRELGLENSTDSEIWNYANDNDYTIVTFDSDFYDMNLIKGHPPRIIWLRLGNTKTNHIANVLRSNSELIIEFLSNDDYKEIGCLEINE